MDKFRLPQTAAFPFEHFKYFSCPHLWRPHLLCLAHLDSHNILVVGFPTCSDNILLTRLSSVNIVNPPTVVVVIIYFTSTGHDSEQLDHPAQ